MILDKNKILFIGAGKNQLPYMEAFLERDYSVIAVDRDPKALGFQKAEISLPISTHDKRGVLDAVYNLPAKDRIVGVSCPSTGLPYLTAAGCAQMLNVIYPSETTVTILLNKFMLWQLLHQNHLTNRRCLALNELSNDYDKIELPAVFKPQLAGGGHRGVNLCQLKSRVPEVFYKAARNSANGGVVIESFCQGTEYKVCGLIQGGEIKLCRIAQQIFGGDGVPGLPIALSIGPSKCLQVNEFDTHFWQHIKTVCHHIGLKDAPFNIDIILTSEGIEIIDVDIVLGSFARLLNMSLGIDIFAACADLCLGRDLKFHCQHNYAAAVTYLWFYAENVFCDTVKKICREMAGDSVFESRLPKIEKITTTSPACAGALFSEGETQEKALSVGKTWVKKVQTEMDHLFPGKFNIILGKKGGFS